MAKTAPVKDSIDFDELGIGQNQESDRIQLDARGAISIIKIRFDYKTKYYNEKEKTGTPITKFDGVDIATGEIVKYYTVSGVIYKSMAEILAAVGATIVKDENNVEWSVLKKPVNIGGFEKVQTGVRGQNPYLKIKKMHE